MKEEDLTPTNEQLGGSLSEPDGNADFKGVEYGGLTAPVDSETSKKSPKRQRPRTQYDDGACGSSKAYKKRKQDSAERDSVDSDGFDVRCGKVKSGRKRNDEEGELGSRKFACPFYKHDPQSFMSSRTCVGPGWDSVHRVKGHIFRRHKLSDSQRCDCFVDFGTQPTLDGHRKDPCRQRPPPRSDGINKEQERQLKSRKMYQKSLSEEEKWRAIYTIIFPDEKNIPSPYYEAEVPEFPDCYRQILIEKLPGIIIEELTASGSDLMRRITGNMIANPAQTSADPQLVRQVENVVKAAVLKALSQMDGSTESNDDFQISRPNAEVQVGGTEQVQMRQTSPPELDWPFLIGEDHSDNALPHTSGAVLQEPWDFASNTWDNSDNHDALSIGWQDASAHLDLGLNVSGLAGGRNQLPLPILETQPQVFSQGHVQSAGSGHESVTGALDSDYFDNWALLDQTTERIL